MQNIFYELHTKSMKIIDEYAICVFIENKSEEYDSLYNNESIFNEFGWVLNKGQLSY